jgi:multiple sugar transport system ATP-binding protein
MGLPRHPQRHQELRAGGGAPPHRPRGRGRGVPGPRRPLGMREVDAPEHDRGARGDHLGRHRDQRARGERGATLQAQHRHGVPELRALPQHDGGQNITFGPRDARRPQARARPRAGEVAKLSRSTTSSTASRAALGRAAQRVAMGRALVRNPDVFLFDEPLSNLDAKLRVDMRTEIKKLHQRLGRTIVYVTHDQIEAMTLSTRIAVMNKGYVQQFGTPKGDLRHPANLFVALFMGSPVDEPPAAQARGERRAPCGRDRRRGQDGPCGLSQGSLARLGRARARPGIRPEADHRPRGADRKSLNVQPFRNPVSGDEPAGADTFVTTTIGGQGRIARMRARRGVAPARLSTSPSTWTRPWLRPRDRESHLLTDAAGRPHHRLRHGRGDAAAALAPTGRRACPGTGRAPGGQPRGARSSRHLRARPLPPQGGVARRRRAGLQPRQLRLCGRQHEILWSGPPALPRRGLRPLASLAAPRPAGPSLQGPGTRVYARAEALYRGRATPLGT